MYSKKLCVYVYLYENVNKKSYIKKQTSLPVTHSVKAIAVHVGVNDCPAGQIAQDSCMARTHLAHSNSLSKRSTNV